ncbi:MAG: ATP-binding protein, partial [Chloroflexota bacterium]
MQAGAGAQSLLRATLRNAASVANPQRAIADTLESLRTSTGAAGASITRSPGGQHIVAGDASAWAGDVKSLAAHIPAIPNDMTRNVPLDGISITATAWYTLKPTTDLLLSLWYVQSAEPPDEDVVAVHADVLSLLMAQHRMNLQQERSNLLANSILGSIADPLLVLDDNRTVMLMNPAAEALFDVGTAESFNQPLAQVVRSPSLIEILDNQKPEGQPTEEWTINGLTYLPLLSPINTPDGMPDGWVLSLRDVTRFKRLNRNQQEFMRVVSHDLRSPLTSIQGFADMVRMGMVGEVTEKQVYFMDKIMGGIVQMTSIVDNIQDAGRFDPETGFYEMQRAQVDLAEVASKIVQNQIVPAEKQNLYVELSIAEDVPIMNLDENMINRAITNLVDNAIKYTPDGGRVEVNIQKENRDVIISVRDDGYGISEENQKKLFRRHSRIHRKEHARVKGTGLGLFIVRSVAQHHGG